MLRGKIQSSSVSYDFRESLGEGLNGVVYRAVRSDSRGQLRQDVAIKILKANVLAGTWESEFNALLKVNHNHCVKVFGFERIHDQPALVLEYLEGLTLRELLLMNVLTQDCSHEIAAQMRMGLSALHSFDVIHGDLSPNNVMITVDGVVKLLDFGCNRGGIIQATPEFAAPELLNGGVPSVDTDLISLSRIEQLLLQDSVTEYSSTSNGRKLVSEAVKLAVFRKNQLSTLATRTLQQVPQKRKKFRRALGVAFALLLAPGVEVRGQFRPRALIRIPSHQWLKIKIDNQWQGFAPLRLELSPGTHEISWESHGGRGKKKITLAPGEDRLISDKQLR